MRGLQPISWEPTTFIFHAFGVQRYDQYDLVQKFGHQEYVPFFNKTIN